MKVPISKRLLCCASLVKQGASVADIGADHGYLGIYLLLNGIAAHVYASDLREKPIAKARENAGKYGVADSMDFFCAPGLDAIPQEAIDTVVCAGMGSDSIMEILEAAPWLKNPRYSLILEPQSSGQDLRNYLAEQGFRTLREELVQDGGFLYSVILAAYDGTARTLTPGRQYLSEALLESHSPLLEAYRSRLLLSLENTVRSMEQGNAEPEKLGYYRAALREIQEK